MSVITFEKRDNVGEIVINNPPQNRFSAEALSDFGVALGAATASDVGALLLRAEGPDFSLGADPTVFDGVDEASAPGFASFVINFMTSFEELPMPTIALVQGRCFDGALESCLVADLMWAAEGTQFSQIEVGAGAFPWGGGTQRLASRIGSARAAEMVLTARTVSAEDMLAWGGLNRIVPANRLLEDGRAYARDLASGPKLAHAAIKNILRAWRRGGTAEADRVTVAEAPAVMLSEDLRNGLASFKEHGVVGHATFHGR
jgi:enoyl-CoA hydratase/carnithine racemase